MVYLVYSNVGRTHWRLVWFSLLQNFSYFNSKLKIGCLL